MLRAVAAWDERAAATSGAGADREGGEAADDSGGDDVMMPPSQVPIMIAHVEEQVAGLVRLREEAVLDAEEAAQAAAEDEPDDDDVVGREVAALRASGAQTAFEVLLSMEGVQVSLIDVRDGSTAEEVRTDVLCAGAKLDVLYATLSGEGEAASELLLLRVGDDVSVPLHAAPDAQVLPCVYIEAARSFLLPTPHANTSYAFILPRGTPTVYEETLQRILSDFCVMRVVKAPGGAEGSAPGRSLSERALRSVASGLTFSAGYLSLGIATAGQALASGVTRTGEVVRHRVAADEPVPLSRPGERSRSARIIASTAATGARVTPHLVFASSTAIETMLSMATETGKVLGGALAETERGRAVRVKAGLAVEEDGSGGGAEAESPAWIAAREAARAAVLAADQVWTSLETAGVSVYTASAGATEDVVRARYGAEAASVASDSASSLGNLARAAYVARGLRRGLVRRVAGRAASTVAREYILVDVPASDEPLSVEGQARRVVVGEGDALNMVVATLAADHAAEHSDPLAIEGVASSQADPPSALSYASPTAWYHWARGTTTPKE